MGLWMFNIFPIFFFIMFALVFGLILTTLIRGIRREQKNDAAPRLTVEATVVTKRTHVHGHDHARTNYYATFQVASGDRMELSIPYSQFGYLVEGDRGNLTFQGTRFISFERS